MGNRMNRDAEHHPEERIYTNLFEELSVNTQSGIAVVHRQFFEGLFGGPCHVFGELLYARLFGSHPTPITLEAFLKVSSTLEKTVGSGRDRHASINFLFSLFSKGEDEIHEKELETIILQAMGYSLVMGTALHEEAWPKETPPIITSIVKDMSHHVDKDSREISVGRFRVWCLHHLPRLMEGIQQWILAILHGHYITGMDGESKDQVLERGYHLPELETPPDLAILLDVPTVWALSCVLPVSHLGHSKDERHPEDYSVGGRWILLYSSAKHGFSLNRFLHHSSDYEESSVVVMECHAATGEDYVFVIAVDTAWKEGEFFWGKDNCCLIQLKPEFKKIVCGPKLICLNEKGRQFPKGLRVMTDKGDNQTHIHIEEDFNKVHLFGGNETVTLKAVEVWGCGGVEAVVQQQKWKEWEKREVERRRKVTRESREAWQDNPDRAILEWGGVTTEHPKEQQQE